VPRPQRVMPWSASASVISTAIEPQYVYGAATPGWHLHTEIKSEHATDCRVHQALESGKKAKTRSEGECVSWQRESSYGLGLACA
jgi:hypothetical protein